jgi:hypothetical protein
LVDCVLERDLIPFFGVLAGCRSQCPWAGPPQSHAP